MPDCGGSVTGKYFHRGDADDEKTENVFSGGERI
jgi:hypothetical protein